MDKFITRLKYYGIGFAIGLVFVFVFFQNRGCSWLPSNRVKNAILDRVLVVSEKNDSVLKKISIDKKKIIRFLNEGDVLFSKSKKDGFLKVYIIELNQQKLHFLLPKDAFICEVKLGNEGVQKVKTSAKGFGTVIRFPNEKHLLYADSTLFNSCNLKKSLVAKSDQLFKIIQKKGKIDFNKTNYFASPKAQISWYLPYQNDSLFLGTYWYKNKMNISTVTGRHFKDCN